MSIAGSQVVKFSPAGLSDAEDGTNAFPGACTSLQNLIPDPATRNVWMCRPGSVLLGTLTGPITALKVVGTHLFGFYSSTIYPGYDQPFVFDLVLNQFVTLTGITGSTVLPVTQPTGVDWHPPTMDLVGVYLVVTHPGFNGSPNYFGWFNISNFAAPTWNVGNTTTNALTTPPSWVVQFGERAYFGLNPATGQPSVVATDVLTLNVTNASQALSFGDNIPLTAACGLPLHNQLGGIIQSLIVFKGSSNIFQVTGDFAGNTWAINALNVATGTLSPGSVCATPIGVAFLAPDGYRFVQQDGSVSPPVGVAGGGVAVPFISVLLPTRVVAACNAFVLRVTAQPFFNPGTPWQEYWFDIVRKVWSGPHTSTMAALAPNGAGFVGALQAAYGIYQCPVQPEGTTQVTEAGAPLQWSLVTATMPDPGAMAYCEMNELTIDMGFPPGATQVNVVAQDQNASPIAQTTYQVASTGTTWGNFLWGQANWASSNASLYPRRIPFTTPVVYRIMSIGLSGQAISGLRVGSLYMRRVVLGYDVVN